MTAILFVSALLFGPIVLASGHVIIPVFGWSPTLWVMIFAGTLSSAFTATLISRDWRLICAGLVLVLNFAGSHWAWSSDNPILYQGVLDLLTAGYFLLWGVSKTEAGIAALYTASTATAVLTHLGLVPSHLERDLVFLAWSYPDVAALLGHAANIVLGMGAGDAGFSIRRFLGRSSVASPHALRVAGWARSLAQMARAPRKEG